MADRDPASLAARGKRRSPVLSALRAGDQRVRARVDAVTHRSAHAAGKHLVCHAGCTPCCFGPFAITQLDAWRLREGLRELGETDAARATAVSTRAQDAVATHALAFPPEQAGVFENEADEQRFYERFADDPCPALDPESGACVLYESRPVVCRTYGAPIRVSGTDLSHCPLCFKHATPAQTEAARGVLEVDDLEDPLIEMAEAHTGQRGMTTVAFALARESATSSESSESVPERS